MYSFTKVQDKDGVWQFELNGIKLVINDFFVKDEKHWIKNPNKAIGYFNLGEHLYGVSNREPITFNTAEDFYDIMRKQYMIFAEQV